MFSDNELRLIAKYEQFRQEWMGLHTKVWQESSLSDQEHKRFDDLDDTLCEMEDQLPEKYEYPKTL